MENGAERLIEIMRKQGAHDNAEPIKIGTVTGENINLGSLVLSKGDYYINSDIKIKDGDEVVCVRYSDEYYIVLCKVVR